MRVGVIGLGHVGLVTAACLAHVGHQVAGWDDDRLKLDAIAAALAPFFEPGLSDLIGEGLDSGRLRVAEGVADIAKHSEIVLICVGIPVTSRGDSNLSGVESVVSRLLPHLQRYTVLAEKSTVPVGTGARIEQTSQSGTAGSGFDVASTPEFLREGQAVEDTLHPARIVVGANSDRAHAVLRELYRPIVDRCGCPYVVTDVATAELIKHASNAFLATRISFINMVADVCESTGADVEVVAEAMGLDPRIGSSFLEAGIGYGGACLPKDVIAFRRRSEQLGVDTSILIAVAKMNEGRTAATVEKVRSHLGGLAGRRVAVWGLAFKAGTDDVRESRAIELARLLRREGAAVVAYDPAITSSASSAEVARREALSELGRDPDIGDALSPISLSKDPYEAVEGADALVIGTAWDEFASIDLSRVRSAMRGNLIVDGRNVLDVGAVTAAGFVYASVGRPVAYPSEDRS